MNIQNIKKDNKIKTIREDVKSSAIDDTFKELDLLKQDILLSKAPIILKEKMSLMHQRLERMAKFGNYSQDFEYISNYIGWVKNIPWDKHSEEVLDLELTKENLEKEHYGMPKVKERILEYIARKQLLTQKSKINPIYLDSLKVSPILCFVGLQGVGKTTVAKSIAKSLGREFIRVSMGALGTPLELRGKNKAQPGAEPGQIIKALVRTKVKNPLILLDELDKVSSDERLLKDFMAILLEILDPEQNTTFRDHYLDYPIDLSSCLFIVSANTTGSFSAALMDRLEIIKFPSYSDHEKTVIARDYLLPKILIKTGLDKNELVFKEDLWPIIIKPLGYDSGIRSLQKNLTGLARKAAKQIVTGEKKVVVIDENNFKDYLPNYY